MNPLSLLLSLLPLLSLSLAAPATIQPRQNLPPGDRIQIQSVTLSGSGCPANSTANQISLDRTAVTVGFDRFAAELNPASERDKTCNVVVVTSYPLGCIVSQVENTHHGFAEIPNGVSGSLVMGYSVAPGRLTTDGTTLATLSGPIWATGQPWVKTDVVGTAVNVNNAAARTLFHFVNARVFLSGGGGGLAGLRTDDMTIAFTNQRRAPGQC